VRAGWVAEEDGERGGRVKGMEGGGVESGWR